MTDKTALGSFSEIIEKQIKDLDESLIPLLRVYLNDVRSVRMALASEITDILRSSREVGDITKKTEDIIRFCAAVETLKQVLTPEILETMRKL